MNPAAYYLSSLETYTPYVPTPVVILPSGQVWDKYNLNTSVYNDGTPIPRISSSGIWPSLTTGACRFYNNDSSNANLYGRLYNWYAVNGIDGSGITKDIAPEGWRVATLADWQTLSTAVGGNSVSGGVLKETGTTYWTSPNTGAANTYGFGARGGGYAIAGGSTFTGINTSGYWWPFGEADTNQLIMTYNSAALSFSTTGLPNRGYSVRLIKKDVTVTGFTTSISNLNALSITGTGTFTDVPPDFIEKGICWSTSANPNRFVDPYVAAGDTNKTTYSLTASPLVASTTYYVRAYIKIDSTDVRYSTNIISFTTLSGAPISITTTAISNVGSTTATSGGTITDNASYPTTQRGVCWNTTGSPTTSDSKTTDTGSPFTSYITGLSIATTYYVRSYCINAAGTFYGNNLAPFTTLPSANSKPIFGVYAAYHAYSLRLVGQGYTGFCVRVRRQISGVNAFADLRFNGTSLNSTISMSSVVVPVSGTSATTLGQFAAAAGFSNPDGVAANQSIVISTWYDQSGNNKDVVQAVFTASPFIVTNGNLEIKEGNVAARYAGGQSLALTDTSIPMNNLSCYVVSNFTATTVNSAAYGLGVTTGTNRLYIPRDTAIAYNTSTTFPVTGMTPDIDRLYELTCGSSTTSAYSNGTQLSPTTVASMSGTSAQIRVGSNGSVVYLTGYIKEAIAIIGDSSLTRTDIETNINTYYSIW